MSGYIGSKTSVTQVDGYNRTEADAEFVQDPNGAITVSGSNVDVTGTITSDGLTVDNGVSSSIRIAGNGNNAVNTEYATLEFYNNDPSTAGPNVAASIKAISAQGTGSGAHMVFGTTTGSEADGTSALERMRIDSSGNVGIGTSSPNHRFHLENYNASLAVISDVNGSSTIFLGDTADNNKGRIIYTQSIDTMKLLTNGSEAMRIDSSGNLLVGTTARNGVAVSSLTFNGSAAHGIGIKTTGPTGSAFQVFYNSAGTAVGSISQNGGSGTGYNTSSDYRLKTDAQPMTGASARVQALKPVNFEWIVDGSRVDGFLAHEAQEVVPEAVSGTKDAMRDEEYEVTPASLDDDGNVVTEAVMGTRSVPDYQGIDQSKLVPLLTAALQEALTKIDDMETRLAALEAV